MTLETNYYASDNERIIILRLITVLVYASDNGGFLDVGLITTDFAAQCSVDKNNNG